MTAFQSPTRLFLYKIIPIQAHFGIAIVFAKAGWRGTVKIQGGMALRRNKGRQFLPPLEPAGILPKGCWITENCNHLSVFTRKRMYRSYLTNAEVQEGSLKQGRNKKLLHKFSSLTESEDSNTALRALSDTTLSYCTFLHTGKSHTTLSAAVTGQNSSLP